MNDFIRAFDKFLADRTFMEPQDGEYQEIKRQRQQKQAAFQEFLDAEQGKVFLDLEKLINAEEGVHGDLMYKKGFGDGIKIMFTAILGG